MKSNFFSKSKYTLFFIILFSAISIPVIYHLQKTDERLPIYNPADVNPQLVDVSIRNQKKNHTIANFKLINQNGDTITNTDYDGKIYIADFFFTRCKTICVAMAYNMSELQEYYKNDDDIMFLSHSVTPVIDSVSVLKKYAESKGVIDGKWNVTTGNKKEIYNLARKSYFAVLDDGNGDENDFIHTENFILVDKDRRIRGMYDGTKKEDMQKIIKDISLLKQEYAKK
ncbi:SCO family protein [Tenacibaculum sp. UWU-22]|uniref:SCO family protein n=1 Tax=Tenacibaculum sp. UWU-22 TaxID=3234187 RepID=UPI0034DB5BFF